MRGALKKLQSFVTEWSVRFFPKRRRPSVSVVAQDSQEPFAPDVSRDPDQQGKDESLCRKE